MDLDNEIALVTGASRGLGKAILHALAAQGATVIGTATSDAGAQKISAEITEAGKKGMGLRLDVCDQSSVDKTMAAIIEKFAAPSILVNNAGITRDNLFLRMKEDEWLDVIDTNLNSLYRLCKACIRPMTKARKGRIINIASVVGLTGNAGQTNYAAAKAGMGGFTKSLAREIGSRNITVNCIAPGFIETDMTDALSDEQKAGLMGQIAAGRLGQPEDIAAAACFLASSGASYITGETLNVNGGMYMA
ncbi:MAG: 3-oxoacyl-ACP reductase [Gammaproteobacteria bacterium]|nr:3-oxoacyl-ACP reductase FabG [Gammaproteobacteria bacterium]PCH62246.1 MAG: 3-oxoacyl-ACP reductase [Gammaproteobacteria bacterium]